MGGSRVGNCPTRGHSDPPTLTLPRKGGGDKTLDCPPPCSANLSPATTARTARVCRRHRRQVPVAHHFSGGLPATPKRKTALVSNSRSRIARQEARLASSGSGRRHAPRAWSRSWASIASNSAVRRSAASRRAVSSGAARRPLRACGLRPPARVRRLRAGPSLPEPRVSAASRRAVASWAARSAVSRRASAALSRSAASRRVASAPCPARPPGGFHLVRLGRLQGRRISPGALCSARIAGPFRPVGW